MKLFIRICKSTRAKISSIFIIFACYMTSQFVSATEANADLYKMCERQSIVIAAELKKNSSAELSARDADMIRLGAVKACLETYKRAVNTTPSISADKKVTTKADIDKNRNDNIDQDDNVEKESIFDRLLSSDKKEDVSPMQKTHRTGGK